MCYGTEDKLTGSKISPRQAALKSGHEMATRPAYRSSQIRMEGKITRLSQEAELWINFSRCHTGQLAIVGRNQTFHHGADREGRLHPSPTCQAHRGAPSRIVQYSQHCMR